MSLLTVAMIAKTVGIIKGGQHFVIYQTLLIKTFLLLLLVSFGCSF